MSEGLGDDCRQTLARWLIVWTSEGAEIAQRLSIEDAAAMARIAQQLVDALIRRILPLPQRYGSAPEGYPELGRLAPLLDASSRRAAREALVARRFHYYPSSELGSAALALHYVDTLAAAVSLDQAAAGWNSLYASMGPFSMALYRTKRKGIEAETIRAVLTAAMTELEG